jgi:HEAT repeat protein
MRAARTLAARRGAAADRATGSALERALGADDSPYVRMAAAIGLGERAHGRRTLVARAARRLGAALADDRNPHARRAAAFALGLCGRAGEAALLAAVGADGETGDRSYLVQATALKALARIRSPRLLATCRAAMDHRGWRDLVPMAALDALAIAATPAGFDLAYAHIRYGETQEVREAAVRLLVALARDKKAKRARPEQAKQVAPTLAALMADPSVFVQLAAVQAAAKLGDRALEPALRRVVREEAWDHLTHSAEKSLVELKKRRGKGRAKAAKKKAGRR